MTWRKFCGETIIRHYCRVALGCDAGRREQNFHNNVEEPVKPAIRWVIVVLVMVVIAILLWLWNPFGQEKVSPDDEAMQQTAVPSPPAAPMTPAVEEPVTALVLFDYDRSALRPGETARLDELSTRFDGGAFDRVDAFGHADRIGSNAYNVRLSGQRAAAVQGYLASKGVDAEKIRTDARGETEPVTGDTCANMGAENRKNRKLIECLQPDRRVQITLVPTR